MKHFVPALFLCTLLINGTSHAQVLSAEEQTLRRTALDRAQAAFQENRFEEALDLAERAFSIQQTPSVQLFIARCQQSLGRHADASMSAEACVRQVQSNPEVANASTIAAQCREIRQRSAGYVGAILLSVPSPAPEGMEVRVAGVVRRGTQLVLPVIVPSGSVLVEATARDHTAFRQEVTVQPRANVPVRIRFSGSTTVADTSIGAGPFVLFGTAGALGVLSLAFLLVRDSLVSDCRQEMQLGEPVLVCTGFARQDEPLLYQTLSATSLALSLVTAAGGGVWLGVRLSQRGRSSREEEQALQLIPGLGGAALRLRF